MAEEQKNSTNSLGSFVTIAIVLVGYAVSAVYWAATQSSVNQQQDSQITVIARDLADETVTRRTDDGVVRATLNDYVSRTLTLEQELVEFRAWRETIEQSRFTQEQGRAMEDRSTFEDQSLRAFIRSVCNDLTRLYIELDKLPPDDCRRP